MSVVYKLDPTAPRTLQYHEIPLGVRLRARFNGWKYAREGVVQLTQGNAKAFFFRDSKGREVFRCLAPDFTVDEFIQE